MHARTKLALAITFTFIAGTLEAAPWERADSKVQGYNFQSNNAGQVRRSTRAYSYTPRAATTTVPTAALQAPVVQAPVVTQAPAPRQMQSVAPRTQPAPVMAVPPANLAPINRGANQPATNYAPAPTRGYRSYSYQPGQQSNGYRNNYSTRSNRVPFYMRADSKVLGRQGM